jgi:hypothetical protein
MTLAEQDNLSGNARAHAGTIDFNGFQEILSNIASVIEAHELKLTGAVVP